MTLTKNQIIDSIQQELDLSRGESSDVAETVLEIIKATLESGESLMVSGFGKFNVKDKKNRRGRNPATGDEMMLKARRVVTFTCSGKLRDKINEG